MEESRILSDGSDVGASPVAISEFQDPRFPARGPFPSVHVSGSHREMGLQHGESLVDRIAATVDIYRERFSEAGLEWGMVVGLAARIRQTLADYDEGLLSELEGIAAGADQDLHTLIAVNSRSEILTLAGRQRGSRIEPECTSAACLPDVTAQGHTLIGRNWDQDLRLLDNAVVVSASPLDDPSFAMLTEAGILIRDGLNEHGIGVTGNSLACDQDGYDALGMPVGIVRRRALRHASLARAAKEVFDAPRSTSINHLFAAAGGGAVDLEAAPRDVFWVLPERGIVTHSNHFRDPRACSSILDLGPSKGPSTLYRFARVEQALRARSGDIDVADMRQAFSDHFGWPESVCSHPKVGEAHPTGSVATVVMDLDERTIGVAAHPTCQSEWTTYVIS